MTPDYDGQALRALKELVLSDPSAPLPEPLPAPLPERHEELCREWRRSAALLPSRHLQRLEDAQRDLHVFDRLDAIHLAHLDYLKDYYSAKQDFLDTRGAALFCLDGSCSAFHKGGNPRLLAKLKERGIGIGTSFSEQNVGVFVANTAHRVPFETVLRLGEENYLDLFCDMACYARYGAVESTGFATVNVAFLPLGLYERQVHESLLYVLDVEDLSFKNSFIYPAVAQRMSLLEKSLELSLDAFLLINDEGAVVFADSLFKREFWDPGEITQGIPLQDFMPELKPCLACLRKGGRAPHEAFLTNGSGTSRFYRLQCQQITDGGPGGGEGGSLGPGGGGGSSLGPGGGGPEQDPGSSGPGPAGQPGSDVRIIGLKLSLLGRHSPQHPAAKTALFTFSDLKGSSPPLVTAKEMGLRAASSPSTVLITGESGTGKEMFAHAIHNASSRRRAPFVPISCGAIPQELIGSELFGYTRSSRAGSRREGGPGRFEQANGGTVFLDEVAEMPLDMQKALLRFLEDGVVSRLGSKRSLELDVRIIAASNKNLWECVNQGMFRLDLYFRLNVLRIELPPLRSLQDDLGLLMRHFCDSLCERLGKQPLSLDPKVVELFAGYSWPGNLRELRNIMERCVNVIDGGHLSLDALPRDIVQMVVAHPFDQRSLTERTGGPGAHTRTLTSLSPVQYATIPTYHDFEVGNIRALMLELKGNKSAVAKKLGISRGTLYRKLSEMGY